MKNNKVCHICNKDLGPYAHNKQKYCSEECRKEGRKAKDRVRRSEAKYRKMITKLECKRCKVSFFQNKDGDRFYCKACITLINENETTSYKKKINEQIKKFCLDCNTEINKKRKRCQPCADIRKQEQTRAHNKKMSDDIKKVNEENKNGQKPINPMFLVRNYSGKDKSKQGPENSFGL